MDPGLRPGGRDSTDDGTELARVDEVIEPTRRAQQPATRAPPPDDT
jgi:hypothetical protein